MNEFEQGIARVNLGMTYYEVIPCDKVLREDGNYFGGKGEDVGYAVRNKETGIIEHTTTVLPSAIFQADYFDKALTSLFNPDELEALDTSPTDSDVLVN